MTRKPVLRSFLTGLLALLAPGCLLIDISPPREPLDELWTRLMLAGHYGCWDDGKEMSCYESRWLPREDKIHSLPEGAQFTKYGIFIKTGKVVGWWLTGGLIGQVALSGFNVELFGKEVARSHTGLFSSGFLEGRDFTYEFFLVVRPQTTGQGRLVKSWRFPPEELALTGSPIDPAMLQVILQRSTRNEAQLRPIVNFWKGERPQHFVDGFLDFDPATKIATVTVTGLVRLFQEQVDLSAALRRDGLVPAPTAATGLHDAAPPRVAITAPASGALLRGRVPITATATDATGLLRLTLTVDATVLGTSATTPLTRPLDTTTLPDGPHTLSATAHDLAGNEATVSVSVTTDNTLPTLTIAAFADGGTVRPRTPELRVSYSDATAGIDLASFRATLDGRDLTSAFSFTPSEATATPPTPLASGVHTLLVSLADRAGNRRSASTRFTVQTGPAFTLSVLPEVVCVPQGSLTRVALRVTPLEGFTGLVSLSVSGLPTGVTATFSPPTVAPGQPGVLTLDVGATVPAGLSHFSLTGTATLLEGPHPETVPLTLQVLPGAQ